MKRKPIKWRKDVDPQDFEAGRQYLELLYLAGTAKTLVRALKSAPLEKFAAKDILRASELTLLDRKDPDVAKQFQKIRAGEALSPPLLVRERSGRARLIVADGFHRLCAAVHIDENAPVPCKIA